MKARLLLLATLAVVILVAGATAAVPLSMARSYYFEQHGRDDAREWRTTFVKGVRVIKIDFNFQPHPAICVNQTKLNPDGSKTAADFPNGCFVLSHYYDKSGVVRDYSIPQDIVDFAAAPQNQADIFSAEWVARSGPVIVQMCLKNRPGGSGSVCPPAAAISGGSDYAKWTALYDDFYASARTKIAPLLDQGRLEFVFDSLSVTGDACIIKTQRYGNWNSTWTGGIASAQDNTGANRAAQMPNMDWTSTKSWDALANISFGKFLRGSKYPVVAWEPSSELAIDLWYDWWAKHAAAGGGAITHGAGTLVAFNPDPALYNVLASGNTQRFAHRESGADEMEGVVAAAFVSRGLSIVLRCANPIIHVEKLHKHLQCGFHMRSEHSQLKLNADSLHYVPEDMLSAFSMPLLHMAVEGPIPNSAAPSFGFRVTMVDSAGVVHFLRIEVVTPRFDSPPKWVTVCDSATPFAAAGKVHAVNSHIDATSKQMTMVALTAPSTSSSKAIPLSVTAISFSPLAQSVTPSYTTVLDPTPIVADVCKNVSAGKCGSSKNNRPRFDRYFKDPRTGEPTSSSTWLGAGVAARITNSSSPSMRSMRVLACYSIDRATYCSSSMFQAPIVGHRHHRLISDFLAMSSASPRFALVYAIPNVTAGVPVKVGIGQNPTVAFATDIENPTMATGIDNSASFLITFGWSWCQNSMPIDDDNGAPHICNLRDNVWRYQPLPMPVMAYVSSDSIANLEQRIAAGNQHLNGFATVCDPVLLHGIFDTATDAGPPLLYPMNPAFDQDLPLPSDGQSFVAVVPLHSLTLGAPTTCGTSNPALGKVRLDAFPLPGMRFNYTVAN